MSSKDYYKVLGVSKDAGQADIKKAYRKIAVKYHPDKNKGDKQAEEKFKEATEAYDVLGNPEKRKKYDMYGSEAFSGGNYSYQNIDPSQFQDIFEGMGGFSSIFENLFGGGKRRNRRSTFSNNMFGDLFGSGGSTGFSFNSGHEHYQPQVFETEIKISVYESVFGSERELSLKTQSGIKKIKIKIPKGIREGQKLQLKNVSGINAIIKVKITIGEDALFKRVNDDVITNVNITFSQAALGDTIFITNLKGNKIKLKIPKGIQNGAILRIKGQGAKFHNNSPGDFLIKVNVMTPKNLNKEAEAALKKLKELGM